MNDQQPDPTTPPPPPADGPIDWTPRDPASAPPPPPPPGWTAPGQPAGEPTVQQPVAYDPPTMQQPPVAPPPPMAPPQMAPPQMAPLAGAPPQFPPTAPPPAWNQQPGAPVPSDSPKKSRTGLIIGLIVVAALIIGGLAAAAVVLMGDEAGFTVDIEVCEIAADGTMTASGSVQNTSGDSTDVDIDIAFRDDNNASVVATDSTELTVPGDSGARWDFSGTAGDEVQRISCDVTVDD